MFIELSENDPNKKVLVNLAMAQSIEPYYDENETNDFLKTGIVVNFINDVQAYNGEVIGFCSHVYHGIGYEQIKLKLLSNKIINHEERRNTENGKSYY